MGKRKNYLLKRPRSTRSLHQVPGTATYVGRKENTETFFEVTSYNTEFYDQFVTRTVEDALAYDRKGKITWINVDGLNNTGEIERIGKFFNIHSLVIEDIVNTNQRPKIEEYQDFSFIVAKMLYRKKDGSLENEHISFVLGKDFVLSFQEAGGDVFDGVRERIAKSNGRIRSRGGDYLVFSLLDAIVDHYFTVVDEISDKIETLEEILVTQQPHQDITFEIQELKRTMLRIRRAVFPLKEVGSRLEKGEILLVQPHTLNYFSDLHDHLIQITENIEVYREMTWGLMDMYMTSINHKMNEVMKVLTVMASIFIPLTFLVGVYGMNFQYMPELEWKYGYPGLLIIMLLLFLGMIYYFKRKHWL